MKLSIILTAITITITACSSSAIPTSQASATSEATTRASTAICSHFHSCFPSLFQDEGGTRFLDVADCADELVQQAMDTKDAVTCTDAALSKCITDIQAATCPASLKTFEAPASCGGC